MLNATWIATLLSLNVLQANFKEKIYIYIADQKNEPISFLFVVFFLIVILMQFVAMMWHRGITFIQLIRNAMPV
jgi:heme/copper-type cytochrome/quinol oxidase subunit 4